MAFFPNQDQGFCRDLFNHTFDWFKPETLDLNKCTFDRPLRILVTGANGFVGRNLVALLYELKFFYKFNIEITLNLRKPWHDGEIAASVIQLVGDLLSVQPEFGSFDIIFHLAMKQLSENDSHKLDIMENDSVIFTKKILDCIRRERKPRLKKLIFASSGAVYGKFSLEEGNPISESSEDDFRHLTAYGQMKKQSEKMISEVAKDLNIDYVNARLFAFYGSFLPLNTNFAIGNFLLDAINNRRIRLKGSGTSVRSYMTGSDLAAVLVSLAFSDFSGNMNVGDDNQLSIGNLAQLVSAISNVEIDSSLEEDLNKNYYVPNVELMKSIVPEYRNLELFEGISQWFQYLKAL